MKERFQLLPGLYSYFKIICIAFFFPGNLYLGEARLLCSRSFPSLLRCQCELCNDMNLVGALEFRCCRKVFHSSGKLVFDGSIKCISCITAWRLRSSKQQDGSASSGSIVEKQRWPKLPPTIWSSREQVRNNFNSRYIIILSLASFIIFAD